jgi:hypothetical protein
MKAEKLAEQAKELRGYRDDILWPEFSEKSADREDQIWKKAHEIRGAASSAYGEDNTELTAIADQIKGDYDEIIKKLSLRQPRWQVVHARYSIKINKSIVRLTWVLGILAFVQILMIIVQMCTGD